MQLSEAVASGRDVIVCEGFTLAAINRAAGEWGGVTLWVGDAAPKHRHTLTISENELAQWYFTWASPPRVVWCEPWARPVALPPRVQKILLTKLSRASAEEWARQAGFRDPIVLTGEPDVGRQVGAAPVAPPTEARADANTMAHVLERLREFRTQQAEREEVPRYIVFSNKVLMSLAWAIPKDEAEFMAIAGCGPQKWQKYGREVTEICAEARAQL